MRCSSANSRIVSSIPNRGSPPIPSDCRTRLFSTSDPSVSSTSPSTSPRAHLLDCLEPRAAHEHRQAGEQRPLRLFEHVVAPRDRAAQGLLALGEVAGAAGEQSETVLEPAEHRLRREDSDARRRQLDGQRQAVEAHADLRHGRRVLVGHVEVGLHGARALDEQRDGLELRELGERRQVRGIRQRRAAEPGTPARPRRAGCCGCSS